MKKVFLALAVVSAVSFVACNGGDKSTETKTSDTSLVVKKDTMEVIKDTTIKTTVVAPKDSVVSTSKDTTEKGKVKTTHETIKVKK